MRRGLSSSCRPWALRPEPLAQGVNVSAEDLVECVGQGFGRNELDHVLGGDFDCFAGLWAAAAACWARGYFQLADANCDQYAFTAELLSVQSEPRSTVAPIYADSCASGIALARYRVSAPDGYANLRQAPNTKAAITQRLPKQTTVLELKQNGAWKLVQVLEQTSNPVTGFVHQSQVSLMEDEQ